METLREFCPVAAEYWDYSKNGEMTPDNMAAHSGKKAGFICKNNANHLWENRISDSVIGGRFTGCPYCNGRKVFPGENDLITLSQAAREMWDYQKNDMDPTTLMPSSGYPATFKCSRGHNFQRKVRAFMNSSRCPHCDFEDNSIVAAKPEILEWWDYEKNGDDKPENHRKSDSSKAWWKCSKCGYSWKSEIASKFAGKNQCPSCDMGIAFNKGVNDALTRCPEISLDWDYQKNEVRPEDVFIHYKKPVWFKCHTCGYSWKAGLAGRIFFEPDGTVKLRICSKCKGKTIEESFSSIRSLHPDIIKEYVPELNEICLEDIPNCRSKPVMWRCSKCNQIYKSALITRIGANRSGKGCPYCDHKKPIPGINDFATCYPELIQEWDFKLNKEKPSEYTKLSPKKVHWICSINPGHKWVASINVRAKGMMKCPYCREKKPSHKLHEVHPELLKYWDYEKNTEHGPEYYNEFSNEIVFWKCENGHSFKHRIFKYSQKGFYCIICKNTQLVPDVNDLQTMYPDIAAEFDCELNDKKPEDFKANSSESVWWKCPIGHSPYKRTIRERVIKGKGCGVCANTVIVAGANDALSAHPRLSEIWDYKANSGKKPEEIFRGSTGVYDYVCKNGHHWSERLTSVVNALYTCAYCSDRKALPGFNTLADRCPELADQWDEVASHNKGYNPYGITTQIKATFSWICPDCSNTFLSSIQGRITDETKCPYCAGKKVLPGVTSLKAVCPEITSEYSVENEFDSDMILPTFSKPVYWNCNGCGQQWWSTVSDRINKKANCPYCNGRKAIRGKNSLKALYPQMAEEIITEDNRDSDDILPTYAVKVHWNCAKCDQLWVSTVKERVNREAECPYCAGKKPIPGKTSFKAIYPEMAVEFSNKNEQDPDNVLPTYGIPILWNCTDCGLEWSSTVKERVNGEVECPYCAGKKPIPGKTSFAATRPDLMEEWNVIANWMLIDPDNVLPDNQKRVWWKCKVCNRNYPMSIKTRINYDFRHKKACPYCKGYRRMKHHFL